MRELGFVFRVVRNFSISVVVQLLCNLTDWENPEDARFPAASTEDTTSVIGTNAVKLSGSVQIFEEESCGVKAQLPRNNASSSVSCTASFSIFGV